MYLAALSYFRRYRICKFDALRRGKFATKWKLKRKEKERQNEALIDGLHLYQGKKAGISFWFLKKEKFLFFLLLCTGILCICLRFQNGFFYCTVQCLGIRKIGFYWTNRRVFFVRFVTSFLWQFSPSLNFSSPIHSRYSRSTYHCTVHCLYSNRKKFT